MRSSPWERRLEMEGRRPEERDGFDISRLSALKAGSSLRFNSEVRREPQGRSRVNPYSFSF